MSSVVNTKRLDKEALSKVKARYNRTKGLAVVFGVIGVVLMLVSGAVNVMSGEKTPIMDLIGGLSPILGLFFLFMTGLIFMIRRALKTYIEEREAREKSA